MKVTKIISLLSMAILITSCHKYQPKEIGMSNLTDSQLQIIPYTEGQVVNFIDSAGFSVGLIVAEDRIVRSKARLLTANETDYITYEARILKLKKESNNLTIDLRIRSCICLNAYDDCSFEIIVNPYSKRAHLFSVDTGGVFLGHYSGSDNFYDSIEINNKIYYDVVCGNFGTSNNSEIPMQLFYNKTYGILQIKKDGKDFLTINN